MANVSVRTWPRRRLQIRSMVSSTLPFGWMWAAGTALLSYFMIGHGPGSSVETVLGADRATLMSLHVWSSIAVGALTVVHVILNRRGVVRSLRIASGVSNRGSSRRTDGRLMTRLGAAALVLLVTVGGFAFAAVDSTHDGRAGSNRVDVVRSGTGQQAGGGGGQHGQGRR